jgi:preprotein translocase subunit SecE
MVTMLQGAKKKATKSGAYVGDVLYEMYKTRFPQADQVMTYASQF